MATPAVDGPGMDVWLQAERLPLCAGDRMRLQLLRAGALLAGLAVELRKDLSPPGIWHRTDVDGRVEMVLPLAARWILRGTDLRPAADGSERWESSSVTLVFELLPRR